MPGPGGGRNSGGGGRGGGFGGRGGSFHGGNHVYHGSGYLKSSGVSSSHGGGGLHLGKVPAILLISILLSAFLIGSLAFSSFLLGWKMPTDYDEDTFRTYASEQYSLHFSDSDAYEDNLLIVVLTKPNHKDFYYIAWLGDHIHPTIKSMLGNNDTPLGRIMNNDINAINYKPSLDSDLVKVVEDLTILVSSTETDTKSSFLCNERNTRIGKFVNHTKLSMDASLVEPALQTFADYTGISITLVVEDASAVLPTYRNYMPWVIFLGVGVVSVTIVTVVYNLCDRRKSKKKH